MLKIFNDLRPFFDDCYRRINIREYAKIMGISPPTASTLLFHYKSEEILKKTNYKNLILFYANKESRIFIDMSRIYWRYKLDELMCFLEKRLTNPTIILFGSLSKAETKGDSDVDLAIFSEKKNLDMGTFEKKIKRKIEIHWFDSLDGIKNRELAKNIANGYVLRGRI